MGEVPKAGQVWVRRRWWGATQKRTVTYVNVLSRHGAFVTYRAGDRLRNHRDAYLDDWHRWSRKATLVKEATHGDC